MRIYKLSKVMKDLIKRQNEELRYKANTSSSLGGFDLGVFDDVAHQNLRSFISKVRKETAEAVTDRMIGKEWKIKTDSNYKNLGRSVIKNKGYNERIKEEKETVKQILKEL